MVYGVSVCYNCDTRSWFWWRWSDGLFSTVAHRCQQRRNWNWCSSRMDDIKATLQPQLSHHVLQCANIGDVNVFVQVYNNNKKNKTTIYIKRSNMARVTMRNVARMLQCDVGSVTLNKSILFASYILLFKNPKRWYFFQFFSHEMPQ